ncbi:hypothetical protein [uncultured Microbacterium sp.]|uniref:hypothetical protein n=1 Tax=uncultured Microbacterium sp. TaxID=191216 RepID=UPI00260D5E4A|nr:hypothetical protein [uncultured Microbacterium sp.]
MRWDRFFEDLEDQLDSEWEAERAALDTEAERLRLSRIPLRERIVALAAAGSQVAVETVGEHAVTGGVSRVGADWFALETSARRPVVALVPLCAVATLGTAAEAVLSSVREAAPGTTLAQRMTFGFVLRDVVRRRIPTTVHLADGRALAGTIDRAGADHLDLALHEPGLPRRVDSVRGFRLIPFTAVAMVRLDAPADLP